LTLRSATPHNWWARHTDYVTTNEPFLSQGRAVDPVYGLNKANISRRRDPQREGPSSTTAFIRQSGYSTAILNEESANRITDKRAVLYKQGARSRSLPDLPAGLALDVQYCSVQSKALTITRHGPRSARSSFRTGLAGNVDRAIPPARFISDTGSHRAAGAWGW